MKLNRKNPLRVLMGALVVLIIAIAMSACQPATGPTTAQQFTDPSEELLTFHDAPWVDPATVQVNVTTTDLPGGPGTPDADSSGVAQPATAAGTYYMGLDLSKSGGTASASGCREVTAEIIGRSVEWYAAGGSYDPLNQFPDVFDAFETMKWCWNSAQHIVHQSGTGDSWWSYYVNPSAVASVDSYAPPNRERYEYRPGYPTSGILIEDDASICNCFPVWGRTATVYPWIGIYGHDDGTYTIVKHNRDQS